MPLLEVATVTVFLEGLRTGVARTEVFRVHPASFEEAVNMALDADLNCKSARLGWTASQASSSGASDASNGTVPMGLSYAEDEEAELQAAEQHIGIVDAMCADACSTCVQTAAAQAAPDFSESRLCL